MGKGLKTVRVPRGYEGLHIEVDGAIVNIRVGLQEDSSSKRVTSISITASQFYGEPPWKVIWPDGYSSDSGHIRVREEDLNG
jgi:hypothetical protein